MYRVYLHCQATRLDTPGLVYFSLEKNEAYSLSVSLGILAQHYVGRFRRSSSVPLRKRLEP